MKRPKSIMCWPHLLFCVLSDDRFILKQMPRLEVQSFLDFAPHYFTYITGAVQQKVGIIKKSLYLGLTAWVEVNNNQLCTTAADSAGKDPGCLQDWLQELPEQHGEETGPARDGKSLLWTQDGSGKTHSQYNTVLWVFLWVVFHLTKETTFHKSYLFTYDA